MCGIAGYFDSRGFEAQAGEALVRAMARAVAHRGPDGEGTFVDGQTGLALGHRRLSIIDLSDAGAQPMASASGEWVVVYNGEIYNFESLRGLLEERHGIVSWRGHSDTEVLLEAIANFGFAAALKRLNGMFAIAAFNRREHALYLARDAMGEKPLYYGWQGPVFLFGSELKALTVHPAFLRRIEPVALRSLTQYGCVQNPLCIYKGIAQLKPGHFVRLALAPGLCPAPVPERYWTLPEPVPEPIEDREAIETLRSLLGSAVSLRMRADVPTGVFLSGGIDSSVVAALMQKRADAPVRSFSIGFSEDEYDESPFAGDVARHIGSTHTEMIVAPQDALALVPSIADMYDEPFADSSQIPTHLLCRLTRSHVKVALSGDGGDELFGGYGRYFDFERSWKKRNTAIDWLRPAVRRGIAAMPEWVWLFLHATSPRGLRAKFHPQHMHRVALRIGIQSKAELYDYLLQQWNGGMLMRTPCDERADDVERPDIERHADPFLGMMHADQTHYLPDDILVKVDRASMAVGLETRMPMLDRRIVEFAARLPLDLKRRGGAGKWLLRRLAWAHVPRELVDRPKQGFALPLPAWLRGPLKSWSEELLNDTETIAGELIDLKMARGALKEHMTREVDHSHRLWTVLMFVAWARRWRPL